MASTDPKEKTASQSSQLELKQYLREAFTDIANGSVEIVVHDGRVVTIERRMLLTELLSDSREE